MSQHIVRTQDVAPQPWKNGGGTTRELLTWPAASGPLAGADWRLRISVACIAHDGPFSRFPGVQRWFAVLDGGGVELALGPARLTLMPGDAPLAFHGHSAPQCTLRDGPTQDLNLMCQGGQSFMKLIANNDSHIAGSRFLALYAATAGIWSNGRGDAQALPAHTLLWDATLTPGQRWHFTPADQTAAPAGYWLGYAPSEVAV
ncbi:MAG: hypothetical protein RLZZ401_1068 [Pseudomonadota bacterium]|jgi:environmental stress-induced protein Ves